MDNFFLLLIFQRSDVPSLRNGIIKTVKNIGKVEFTILVVGETGVGKSSVLEFIANVLAGNSISDYNFSIIDQANESGGSGMNSQTNSAKLYSFTSQNGVVVSPFCSTDLADWLKRFTLRSVFSILLDSLIQGVSSRTRNTRNQSRTSSHRVSPPSTLSSSLPMALYLVSLSVPTMRSLRSPLSSLVVSPITLLSCSPMFRALSLGTLLRTRYRLF